MKVRTEKEAEKLVCPFIAEMGQDGSGYVQFHKHINCITTKCMAWSNGRSTNNNPTLGYCERMNGNAK